MHGSQDAPGVKQVVMKNWLAAPHRVGEAARAVQLRALTKPVFWVAPREHLSSSVQMIKEK